MKLEEVLTGRLLSQREIMSEVSHFEVAVLNVLSWQPAIQKKHNKWSCQRCYNIDQAAFYPNTCDCNEACVYCLKCLAFGKLRRCDRLYHIPEKTSNPPTGQLSFCCWPGHLSSQQKQAADEICQSFVKSEDRLVWAVTGAGKTEMIFPVIDKALIDGKRTVIATPRIDVANELYPRFKEAFPGVDILLMHSQSEMSYRQSPLVLCSTHQLIRFKECFDLVIIDEIDAFPFQNSDLLQQAAKRAKKKLSSTISLTATPNLAMQKQIKHGQLAVSILPARYHRHPLPVPRHIWVGDWRKKISQQKIPKDLYVAIQQFLNKKQRFLLFIPNISLMITMEKILQRYFPHHKFTSVSSLDNQRINKVQSMRDELYDFLLTTTILERGVTFSAINVIVLGSEDDTFTMASLVQISGRVGRKMTAPTGSVLFLHYGKTQASQGAIRQIKEMNSLARERGLVDG